MRNLTNSEKSAFALTRSALDATGCGDPGCTEDHSIIYLHPKCHPDAGTWTSYNKDTGTLAVECTECEMVLARIKVASI